MNITDAKNQAIAQHAAQAGEFADRYATLEHAAYDSCFAYSRKQLDRLLAAYLPPQGDGRRLLDVGCGTGHHLARLRERGFAVAGVDGAADMIVHARANNPGVTIEQADVEALPFPARSFDYVLCVEVLRYLPRSSVCVREIARVLKPGGVCLVTAAPRFNLNGYWLVNRLASAVPVPGLVRLKQYFTTSWTLHREFVAAGFSKPRVHGVYVGPVNWIERLAPRVLPAVLRRWEPIDAAVADRAGVRDVSNMFLVYAQRDGA